MTNMKASEEIQSRPDENHAWYTCRCAQASEFVHRFGVRTCVRKVSVVVDSFVAC